MLSSEKTQLFPLQHWVKQNEAERTWFTLESALVHPEDGGTSCDHWSLWGHAYEKTRHVYNISFVDRKTYQDNGQSNQVHVDIGSSTQCLWGLWNNKAPCLKLKGIKLPFLCFLSFLFFFFLFFFVFFSGEQGAGVSFTTIKFSWFSLWFTSSPNDSK